MWHGDGIEKSNTKYFTLPMITYNYIVCGMEMAWRKVIHFMWHGDGMEKSNTKDFHIAHDNL